MTQVLPISSAVQLTELKEVLKKSAGDDELYDLHHYPKMDYEDIFGEPKSYTSRGLGRHIHDGLNKVFGAVFFYVQSTIYYLLVIISGLFMAPMWGLLFGFTMYANNWILYPMFRLFHISMYWASAFIRPMTRIALDPLFESVGQCYSGIKAAFAVQLRGVSVAVADQRPQSMELQEVTSQTAIPPGDPLTAGWKTGF